MMRLLLLALAVSCAQAAHSQDKVAFFGITFLDNSLQTSALGQDPAELERLSRIEAMVIERFEAEGYEFLDIEPVRKEIERIVNPAKCYGCDTRAAAKLGADYSLVGEVQKVSNLILTMNLQMRDAQSGEMVKGRVVDIRGNTDDSWMRGMRYILKNTFFKK